MPQRVIGLWMVLVGILGIVLVAVFVLFGKDARRASASGPRWKRRLLTTGLMLLTAVGIVGCDGNAGVTSARTSVVQDAALDSLLKDPRWVKYRAAWDRAEDIVLGRTEVMPIYSDDKAAAIVALTKARANLDALVKSDLITDAEHRYLKCELSILIASLKGTCVYSAAAKSIITPEAALTRTSKRRVFLQELAKSKIVPESVWKLLRKTVIRDLAAVEVEAALNEWIDKPTHPGVGKFCEEVRQYVKEIDKRSKPTDLHFEKAWKEFHKSCMNIIGDASEGSIGFLGKPGLDLPPESPEYFSRLFRKAKSNLEALRSNKHMLKPVYVLLEFEFNVTARILSEILTIKTKPLSPTDIFVDPGDEELAGVGEILARVKLRTKALGDLAASGRVRPRVIDNALAMAETDYESLTDQRVAPGGANVEYFLKEHPQERRTLASLRTPLFELRKKISQRDPGVMDLGRQYHWVRLREIWRQSERIWEMGADYPFNAYGERHAKTLVIEARRHIQSLRNAGLLEISESKMLDMAFADIRSGIGSFRNSNDFSGTCYLAYGASRPGDQTPEDVRKQLELLEKIQANGKLHPRVLSTLLYGMERNLGGLDYEVDSIHDPGMFDESDAKSILIAKDAILRIERLKAAINAPRGKLVGDKRWLQIAQALQFAARIADPYYLEEYQDRKVSWIELSLARLNLRELLAAGMLTRTESRLVGYQVGRLWETIANTPVFAIETRYRSHDMPWSLKLDERGMFSRTGNSYRWSDGSLAQWLDILGKASGSDQISPVVLKEVLSHIKLVCMGSEQEGALMQDLAEQHPEGVLGGEPEEDVEDDDDLPGEDLLDPGADAELDDKPEEGDK